MKTSKRIWTNQELTIAYYMAKWNMNGIGITEQALVDGVIGNTSVGSFRMQVANFRYLLDIEGCQLTHASKKMKELCEKLSNKTMTQVRRMVIKAIKQSDVSSEYYSTKKNNEAAYKRRDELNQLSETNYQNKLKQLKRYRNLVKK
jgi:hypothetical protein